MQVFTHKAPCPQKKLRVRNDKAELGSALSDFKNEFILND